MHGVGAPLNVDRRSWYCRLGTYAVVGDPPSSMKVLGGQREVRCVGDPKGCFPRSCEQGDLDAVEGGSVSSHKGCVSAVAGLLLLLAQNPENRSKDLTMDEETPALTHEAGLEKAA